MDYNKLVCLCGNYPNAKPVGESAQGKIVTSSQAVAYYFEKDHGKVLRSIRSLLSFQETSEGMTKNGHTPKWFYEYQYTNEQNHQTYPAFLMTRDGFTLLAMGFTGKKALEWKIRYIQAFNEMERKLKEQENVKNQNWIVTSDSKTPDVAPPEVLAQARAKTMLMNARTRQAKLWKTLADESTGTYREICKVYAANILAGKEVLPLPKPPQKTMTATELGEVVGLTARDNALIL